MKLILSLAALFIFQKAIAQHHLILKWNPLSLAEFDQSINVSAEYNLNNRCAVQLEAAYIFAWNILPSSDAENFSLKNIRGIKLKPSIRYYGKCKKTTTKRFVALEPFYKQLNCTMTNTFASTSYVYPFHKKIIGGSIIVGKRQQFYQKIDVEYFAGIGIRKLNYYYSNFNWGTAPPFFNPAFIDEINNLKISPNFNLGFKICYTF
jgi:Protein of unknown function (DUF3575)